MEEARASAGATDGTDAPRIVFPGEHGPRTLPDVDGWGVLHVKPRTEKVVAQYLEDRAVPHFLPLAARRKHYGPRVRERWIPLFPGYVFFDAERTESRLVYASRRVARILEPTDRAGLRRDLARLARALAVTPDLHRAEYGPPGSPVEVVGGPFSGFRGELVRRKGEALLVIRVHFPGFAAATEIDEAYVVPLSDRARRAARA